MEKRIDMIKWIIYMSFIIIIGRLFYLQIISNVYYQELLYKRTNKIVLDDDSVRGRIYDRNGILLVDNKPIRTIYYKNINKLNTKEEIDLAYHISDYLELNYQNLSISFLKDFYILNNEEEINQRIISKIDDYHNRKISRNELYQSKKAAISNQDLEIYSQKDKKAIYLYYLMTNGYNYSDKIIKENCTLEEFMYFTESNYKLNGFNTKYTYEREYIYGDTFKTILGNYGNITQENKDYYLKEGYDLNDKVGLSNIEYVYDSYLRGTKNVYIVNDNDKILSKKGMVGNSIYLTIDIKLQEYVEKVLIEELKKAKNYNSSKYFNHSYIVITDTKGSILSLAGKQIIKNKVYDYAVGTITDTMTVGSVVKGASMLVGYDTKTIKIGEVIKDECIKILNTPSKCSIYTMGYINDIEALKKSSNVYQFKIAIKIGQGNYRYNQPLIINENAFTIYRNYFHKFGLGSSTGIDLVNESTGYKGVSKDPGLLMNFAIGQYDTYTVSQLNQYISTIATNGKRYALHLLKEIKNNNHVIVKYGEVLLNKINIDQKYIKRVQEGLESVMKSGTGYGYINLKYSPIGKTGTSESFMDTNNDNIIDRETISTSFVGYMPSDNPVMAISVMSPNISYPGGGLQYNINKNLIRRITNNYYNIVT